MSQEPLERDASEPHLPDAAEYDSTADVRRLVLLIQTELNTLKLKRAAIAKRIGLIKSVLFDLRDVFQAGTKTEDLRHLFPELSNRAVFVRRRGLAEACRQTLMSSSQPLTIGELCNGIEEKCPSIMARHEQPRVAVAGVLRRLVEYEEVREDVNEKNVRTWRWIAPQEQSEALNDSSSSQLKIEMRDVNVAASESST